MLKLLYIRAAADLISLAGVGVTKLWKAVSFGIALCVVCMGCGSGFIIPNVVPSISQVSPQNIAVGTPNLTVVVKGTNFNKGSVILWNNGTMPTQMVDTATLTAAVSGTVLAVPAVANLQVRNSTGEESTPVQMNVEAVTHDAISPLTVTLANAPAGQEGTPYAATLVAEGGKPGYTWSVTAGSLPAGLNLTAAGVISGTPTASGTSNFTIAVSDSESPAQVVTANTSITVAASQLAVSPVALAAGQMGSAYTGTLRASGGTPGYTWSLASGSLPAGLSLSGAGVISGMPTASGSFSFGVAVSDNGSPVQTQTVMASITVAASQLAIAAPVLAAGQMGSAYTGTLRASGGTPGYTWSLASGSLPAGLNLSGAGVISGTPTVSGSFNFKVAVSDNGSPVQTQTVMASITVAASQLAIAAPVLAAGQMGLAYTGTLRASGGAPGYAWSIVSGSLPTGLSLSGAGVISGTPTVSGSFNFKVAVSDNGSPVQTQTVMASITVAASQLAIAAPVLAAGQMGSAYTGTLRASGGTPGYTWSLASGSLPAGLNLSGAGVISGTPTASGSFSFGVAVSDSGSPVQTQTVMASITIAASQLEITVPVLAAGQMGSAYTGTLRASGGTPGYVWSLASGSLPTGLNLSGAGVISGTPTASGSFSFGVAVSDSGSPVQTQTVMASITVAASQLAIAAPVLAAGQMGSAYTGTLRASGGTPGYTWSLASGSLPAGLNLSGAGVISGTPTASGSFSFGVAVSDNGSPVQTQTATASITVAASQLEITVPALTSGQTATVYTATLQVSGGTPGYTWSLASGSLPAGLNLSGAGVISGTPTASGSFSFGVAVSDSGSPVQTQTVMASITVAASQLTIAAPVLAAGQMGSAYSGTLRASGGTPGYTWSLASGSLPGGLSLSGAGVISGMPTTSGSFSFGVAVSDSGSPVQTQTVMASITVAASQLAIAAPVLAAGQMGSAYSGTLRASGGTPGYTWSLASGSLPTGLNLSGAGVISGTPTASGSFSFGVAVSDSGSPVQTQTVMASITVAASQLAIAAPVLAAGQMGSAYTGTLRASGGTPGYTWSLASGSLPAGLNLSGAGVISGMPTVSGSFSFGVAVSDNGSPVQTQTVMASITVAASQLAITVPALTSGQTATVYTATLQVSGGTPSYTWSLGSGSLPTGLSLSGAGVISGTPTASGNFTFTVAVSDAGSPVQTQTASASITIAAVAPVSAGTTWYVRPDGGTRYSVNVTNGQCDGKSDLAYPGTGTNQHCAFKDVRYLWQDGSYNYGPSSGVPGWGWIGSGGDTYLIRGSLATGVSYRIGWNNKSASCESDGCWGIQGDPYSSGIPAPPSGTATQHTRILGENYAACHAASAKTQLHGGYGLYSVLQMSGSSYVDVACLDITDFSACIKGRDCNTTPGSLDDYAGAGVSWSNASTHDSLTDIHIHGLASAGMIGPTGNGVVMSYLDIIGNPGAGWNADAGDGTTGTGSLLVQHYNISWNGCAEEYPMIDALPYNKCNDDNDGGYGDGFGTATVTSSPGWAVTFDQGLVSYNTQDGLDALHLIGSGSSMTVTRTLAFGNMGQQIKVGGASGTAMNNLIVTNCNAMRQAIPGTPAGYNTNLSDFCRAADTGVLLSTAKNTTLRFDFNTVYSASATGVQIECDTSTGSCDSTSLVDFRNNIFVGFLNNVADGYVNGGTNDYSNPIYNGAGVDYFANVGSQYSNNVTYHGKSNWGCPAQHELNATCADPHLTDETWPVYGYGDMSPAAGTGVVLGAGVAIPGITVDYSGVTRGNAPSIGAQE